MPSNAIKDIMLWETPKLIVWIIVACIFFFGFVVLSSIFKIFIPIVLFALFITWIVVKCIEYKEANLKKKQTRFINGLIRKPRIRMSDKLKMRKERQLEDITMASAIVNQMDVSEAGNQMSPSIYKTQCLNRYKDGLIKRQYWRKPPDNFDAGYILTFKH